MGFIKQTRDNALNKALHAVKKESHAYIFNYTDFI